MGGGNTKEQKQKVPLKQQEAEQQDQIKQLKKTQEEQQQLIQNLTLQLNEQAKQIYKDQKPNENENEKHVSDQQEYGNQSDSNLKVSQHAQNNIAESSQNSNYQDQAQIKVQSSQVQKNNNQDSNIEKSQQQQYIKSQAEQIQESKVITAQIQASMIKQNQKQINQNNSSSIQNTKDFITHNQEAKQNQESNANKQSEIRPNQQGVSGIKQQYQQQQQQQQQNSYIVGNGDKCEAIKSQIKQTASIIIQEKSKSKIGSKSSQKAPKVQFSLVKIMNSLIMIGKMMYKAQAYCEVFEAQDQYRIKYINDLISMINMNLIVFDEIGLNNEDNKEIRNSILKMLDEFLLNHNFDGQIKEKFKFLQNYCTQPELKQIEPIQYDQNMPIIQESESLLEEQFQNFAKFQEDYKKGWMEDQDVEQQENPFLVCHMVICKDDFYTKIINEAKRIKDKTSFNNFLLKLQNNLNQEAYIHFSTFLRIFNDFFNSKSTDWADQLKTYCDQIKEQGRSKEVEQILIDYSQLGHKYCFQYLYTAIHYLESEEQYKSSKDQSLKLVEQLDKI